MLRISARKRWRSCWRSRRREPRISILRSRSAPLVWACCPNFWDFGEWREKLRHGHFAIYRAWRVRAQQCRLERERATGDTNLLVLADLVADPEDDVDPASGKADIDRFADFMRYLAPAPQMPLTVLASAGQSLFGQIGCAACHTPTMYTGPNAIAALDRKPVRLYSDLLLHDMGSLGDGIAQAAASSREMRTAPLWGLRASAPYLHDGRAETVDEAIRGHDGEARAARDRYRRLSPNQKQQLMDFLNSL